MLIKIIMVDITQTLEQLGPDPGSTRRWPVIGQFSSIGSLGATKDAWLCKEWLQSLSSGKRTGLGLETASSPLLLVSGPRTQSNSE